MRTQLKRFALVFAATLTLGVSAFAFFDAGADLNPLALAALPKPPFQARVLERLSAGSYTYFRVERPTHTDEWVVTLSSSSGVRALPATEPLQVTLQVNPIAYSEHFASKRLGRVFDRLHFATVRPL